MSYIQQNPADQGNSVLIFIKKFLRSHVFIGPRTDGLKRTLAASPALTRTTWTSWTAAHLSGERTDGRTDRQTDNRCFSRVVPYTTRRPSKNRLYLNPCCCCCCCCLEPFNSDTVSTASECIGCETMANGGRRTNNFFTNSNLRRNTSRKNAYTVVN